MDKFDRIYALHGLLSQMRLPVKKAKIQEHLECSHATAERIIKEMRLYLNAPIEYDRAAKGYYYNKHGDYQYELPGLWFNSSELYSLLVAYQLLSAVEPGLLDAHIAPLRSKIEKLLQIKSQQGNQLEKRVRILKIASRTSNPKYFGIVATALLTRTRLLVTYLGRARNERTERYLSPQRLVYYRDNWYLDAWCHLREDLRSFAIDRIEASQSGKDSAIEIDAKELETHYATSYGIFAGKPENIAVLKFSQNVAKWIADEHWHPQQKGDFSNDGSYILEIPYKDDRELVMDILKYGPDIEALAPEKLRRTIKKKLLLAAKQYGQ